MIPQYLLWVLWFIGKGGSPTSMHSSSLSADDSEIGSEAKIKAHKKLFKR